MFFCTTETETKAKVVICLSVVGGKSLIRDHDTNLSVHPSEPYQKHVRCIMLMILCNLACLVKDAVGLQMYCSRCRSFDSMKGLFNHTFPPGFGRCCRKRV